MNPQEERLYVKIAVEDYVKDQVAVLQRTLADKIISLDEATRIFKAMFEERLEAANKWREESKERALHYALHDDVVKIEKDIRELRDSKNTLEGKAQSHATWAILSTGISAIAVIVSILGLLIKLK